MKVDLTKIDNLVIEDENGEIIVKDVMILGAVKVKQSGKIIKLIIQTKKLNKDEK